MKKMFLYSIAALLLISSTHIACSSHKEAESEKGTIEKMTDRKGKEMADSITVPIEKARAARELVEGRGSDMEEALKKSAGE
ncbi:MAG: hypothetical protein KAJ10_12240 [Thermodesulfovibrionia bacterium]|nr:hypothetical protein [Thermodesulfovibrionia bacterium]